MTESMRVKNILESLLFAARKPLSLEELGKATLFPRDILAFGLEEISKEFQEKGIRVLKVADGYLMGTNPENVEFVERILHPKEETSLSPQAMETLAIIAYKQPITRNEIERLRGVDSGWVIETLIAKKLVGDAGRSEAPGRPYLYATTDEFIRHFGLNNLNELPPLPASETEQESLFKSALHEQP